MEAITGDYESAKTDYESLSEQLVHAGIVSDNEIVLLGYESDLDTYEELKEVVQEELQNLKDALADAEAENSQKPEDVQKEIGEIADAISRGEKTYELKYSADVEEVGFFGSPRIKNSDKSNEL